MSGWQIVTQFKVKVCQNLGRSEPDVPNAEIGRVQQIAAGGNAKERWPEYPAACWTMG